jgi:hypothetical protein
MRPHRQTKWKSTLTRLSPAAVVEDDTSRLLRFLQTSSPTTKMVGIPDVEIRDAFQTIYQSNRVRRADGIFSTKEGRGAPTEGTVPEVDAQFTSAEMDRALSTLPNRKGPGLDLLPHVAFKGLSPDLGQLRCLN